MKHEQLIAQGEALLSTATKAREYAGIVFGTIVRDAEAFAASVASMGELERALVDVFQALRAAVVTELGADADLAEIETMIATRLRAVLEPERFAILVRDVVADIHQLRADLAPEPEPVTVPDAAPAPAPAQEPAWEYVYDANGIATGTRPLAAPPAPVDAPVAAPEAPAAPVDAAPAETAT